MRFFALILIVAAAPAFVFADENASDEVQPAQDFHRQLDVVIIPPMEIVTPEFVEGAELGPGVVDKDIMGDPPKRVVVALKKIKTVKSPRPDPRLASFVAPSKIIAQKSPKKFDRAPASLQAPKRVPASLAAYPEDQKFSNEEIEEVRAKDRKDYDETLSLVQKAILRGDYGETARERLKAELKK